MNHSQANNANEATVTIIQRNKKEKDWDTLIYYISHLVCALWLVDLASRTLLYGPLTLKVSFLARPINLRDIIKFNILLTSFSRSVLWVTDPHFFLLIYGLRASRLGHKQTGKNSVRNLSTDLELG